MGLIFVLAIVIRLAALYIFRNINNYDLNSYLTIGKLILKGINIYPYPANLNHPYLPFYLWLESMASYFGSMHIRLIGPISLIGHISPIIVLKLINIIFDLGILYLIYLLSNKNKTKALIYALNPISILVFVLHGQFDCIPLFFLLLAVYLLKSKKETLSILAFSFSILTKTWPILSLFIFSKRIKNKLIILLITVLPISLCFITVKINTNITRQEITTVETTYSFNPNINLLSS